MTLSPGIRAIDQAVAARFNDDRTDVASPFFTPIKLTFMVSLICQRR